jgi:signal transduction histidine kinase
LLGLLQVLPQVPWKISVLALLLYGCLLLLMMIRGTTMSDLWLKVSLEVCVGLGICYVLGFNYTGVLLLILADTMQYLPRSRWKFPVAIVICLLYLMLDYDFLAIRFPIIPLDSYLGYFQSNARSGILSVKNIMSSFNTLIFFLYMILLVQMEASEKERILSLNEQLKQANIQLEAYAKESVQMAQTRERNRLAREIHDTLGHALTGISAGVDACIALVDVSPEMTKKQLNAIAKVARQGMTDVRRSVKALRPDALEKFDLEQALIQTMEEMRATTQTEITYSCTTPLNGFNEDEEEIIYRIVQECITNSIRHGKADHIWIQIDREYNMLKIFIRDNGVGCKEIKKGFGLHHMEERMELLQGSLSYGGEDGFLVEALIPIRWGNKGEEE